MPNCAKCGVAAPFHEIKDGLCFRCTVVELEALKAKYQRELAQADNRIVVLQAKLKDKP